MGTFNKASVIKFRKIQRKITHLEGAVTNEVLYTPDSGVQYAEVYYRNLTVDFNGIDSTTTTVDIQQNDPNTDTFGTGAGNKINLFTIPEVSGPLTSTTNQFLAGIQDPSSDKDSVKVHKMFPGERLLLNTNDGLNTGEIVAFNIYVIEHRDQA